MLAAAEQAKINELEDEICILRRSECWRAEWDHNESKLAHRKLLRNLINAMHDRIEAIRRGEH